MRFNDQIYIAPGYTKEEYINLKLSVNSNEATWQKAIDIFKARMEKRFFDKIDLLLKNDSEDAFAAMAVCCLLVETLAQFYEGKNDFKNCSQREYTIFLSRELNLKKDTATTFYANVRCGILHAAQTSKNVVLCLGGQEILFYQNNSMFVDVEKFADKLKEYCENYCGRLSDQKNKEARSNFVKKMNFICNRKNIISKSKY